MILSKKSILIQPACKLMIMLLMVGLIVSSCNQTTDDEIPQGFNGSATLNFEEFTTITGTLQGTDMGFAGNNDTDELFFVSREKINNDWLEIMVKYDVSNGTSQELQSKMIGGATRFIHILNGEVKVIGNVGISTYPMDLSTIPYIQPHYRAFTRLGSVVRNGEMYVIGSDQSNGWTKNGEFGNPDPDGILSNKIRKWNQSNSTFEVVATMPGSKTWVSAEVVNDKLYVFGGQEQFENTDPQSSIFAYDFRTNSFETFEMPEPVSWTFTSTYKGIIIVAGQLGEGRAERIPGVDRELIDRDIFFQVYDPSTNTFTEIEHNLSDNGYNTIHDLTIVDNEVFVIYGDASVNNPNVWTIQKATIDF